MGKITFTFLLIAMISCSGKNENLVGFNSSYSRELTEDEFHNRNYKPTTITATDGKEFVDFEIQLFQAGCMSFEGDIEIKADTLRLNYWNITDEVCDELVVYKLNYRVKKTYAENLPVELIRK
ncbi:MAG: hypothetical protein R2776_06315 [Flavobacteriaceae bacterium]